MHLWRAKYAMDKLLVFLPRGEDRAPERDSTLTRHATSQRVFTKSVAYHEGAF